MELKMNDLTIKNNTEIVEANANLDMLGQRFVSFVESDSPATIRTYKASIKRLLVFFHDNGISHPTRDDIRAYRDSLKATLKPSSVNLYMTATRLFFRWLNQEGFYTSDIADHVKGAKLETGHKKDALTVNQVRNVLETANGNDVASLRDYAIIRLMTTTGLRCIEVTRADIGDIRNVGNDTVLYIQGKGRTEKTEYVKLTDNVLKAIGAYLTARKTTNENQPLFVATSNHHSENGRVTTKTVSCIVKGHMIKAGYNSDRLTAHSLRHTCATLNLMNGGELEETRQLLRHHSINTTLIYAHALERSNNQSEKRIDNVIENA